MLYQVHHVALFPEFLEIYICNCYLIGNNVTLQTLAWIFISIDICDKNNYHTTPIFTIIYDFFLSPHLYMYSFWYQMFTLHWMCFQLLFSFLIFLSQNLSLKLEFTDKWPPVSVLGILGMIHVDMPDSFIWSFVFDLRSLIIIWPTEEFLSVPIYAILRMKPEPKFLRSTHHLLFFLIFLIYFFN